MTEPVRDEAQPMIGTVRIGEETEGGGEGKKGGGI